jgi:hypothetical protein
MDTGSATAGGPGEPTRVGHLILDAYPGSNIPILNKPELILTARLGSGHSDFPHPCPCRRAQSVSLANPSSLPALTHLSAACARQSV